MIGAILPESVSPRPRYDKLFVNREVPLLTLATSFCRNINPSTDPNSKVLCVASQMYGSGKTYLGENFLEQFSNTVQSKLQGSYPKEYLQQIARARYVYVDFRDIKQKDSNWMWLYQKILMQLFDVIRSNKRWLGMHFNETNALYVVEEMAKIDREGEKGGEEGREKKKTKKKYQKKYQKNKNKNSCRNPFHI